MGNQACCADHTNSGEGEIVLKDYQTAHKIPEVNQKVQAYLDKHKPFEKQINDQNKIVRRQYEDDIYEGPLNLLGNPGGYGRLFKKDGSVYVGEFTNGSAHGKGHYIMADGSYYQGDMKNNKATSDNGVYQHIDGFRYEGEFSNNKFHGKGKERNNDYTFEGKYDDGKRTYGTLKWGSIPNQYQYTGKFNDKNQFVGDATLNQPKGIYKGEFLNGLKEGQAEYKYKNGLRFQGTYKNNQKNGLGTIYNEDNSVSYTGDFKDGLPHGKGTAISVENGQRHESEWVEGLEKSAHNELSLSKLKN